MNALFLAWNCFVMQQMEQETQRLNINNHSSTGSEQAPSRSGNESVTMRFHANQIRESSKFDID